MTALVDPAPGNCQAEAETGPTDFLFVHPERAFGGFCSRFGYHLGVSYILAYGSYRPDQARTYLAENRLSWEETAVQICQIAKKGVGFSVYEHNYVLVSRLATSIRALRPELLIVCGGPSATFSAERIMNDNAAIDLCVLGEAEQTFCELYAAGFRRDAWRKIPGLMYRADDAWVNTGNRGYYCSSAEQKDSLDGLPSPYLNGFIPPAAAPDVQVSSSRGCPYSCTYCSFTAIGGRFIRFIPEEVVLAELKMICDHFRASRKRVAIPFSDDHFAVRMARCKRILGELSTFRPENVTFSFQARPDCGLDEEFFSLAKAAGISDINFGLESADPHVLSLVNKLGPPRDGKLALERNYIEQTREQVATAVRHGIDASVSIILGLPGDTEARAKKTLQFVGSLPLKLYGHNLLNIYDGTGLARNYKKYGLDRVVAERAPFPTTIHAYDVNALPFFSHCDRALAYSSHTLARAVAALTGMTGGCLAQGGAPVHLDFADEPPEPAFSRQLPLGTHFLVKSSAMRHRYWRAHGFGSELFEPFDGGFLLGREVLPGSALLPVISFPGQAAASSGQNSRLEFVDFNLDGEFPQSELNHWRLPYAACGLLPACCPAKSTGLRSRLSQGGCVFHRLEKSPEKKTSCARCPVKERCPQCSYLLSGFGDRYCDFQRSDRPFSMLAYLTAHVNVLRAPEFRLDEFPAIRLEDFPANAADARVVAIGDKLHVMRTR